MRYTALALAATLIAGCGSRWPAFDRDALPSSQWPDADRVVLLDDTSVRFTTIDGEPVADVTEHRRVWYRTPRGVEDVSVGVDYRTGLFDLLDFRGRVIDRDGEESTFDRADAVDRPLFGWSTLFSDSRLVAHRPKLAPGAVLETSWTVRYRDVRLTSARHAFAGSDPIVESRLTVHLPPGWQARHLAREAGRDIDWAPAVTETPDGAQVLTWRREAIPAMPRERYAPARPLMAPGIAVQLTRWTVAGVASEGASAPTELSARLFAMQAPGKEPDDAIRARVQAILADAGPDPAERAARLLAYVRDKVRYVSVQLGMGGWIPHPSSQVLDVGYGDCKDKASLLGTMLREAGIPSRQVTVYAHSGWPKRYGLPTIAGNSNHQVLIVDLPDRSVLVDPTRSDAAFGEVPPELQGADVLPLTAEGSPIEQLPRPPPETNRWSLSQRLAVSPAGQAKGTVEVEAVGPSAYGLRWLLRNERGDALDRKLDDALGLSALSIRAVEHSAGVEPTVAGVPLALRARVKRQRDLGPATQVWSLSPDAFVPSGVRRIDSGARLRPIVLGAPRVSHHRVDLTLPPDRRPGALPAPQVIETPFADYALSWQQTDDGVAFERRLTWKQPWLEAEAADDYRAFADQVLRADARALIVRVGPAPVEPAPAGPAPTEPAPEAPPAPAEPQPTARVERGR